MPTLQLSYTPHPFQVDFHKSTKRFRSLIAGRRGGKTTAGAIEAVKHALQGKTLGWCVSPTYSMGQDVTVPEVKQWLPLDAIKHTTKTEIFLKNGSIIKFKSADNPDALRGAGLDWLWLDEACFMKPYTWDVIYPALADKNGIAWVTTTPCGFDWVYEKFYKAVEKDPNNFDCIRFKSIDNPHLDPKLIENARNDLSPQMFRQEFEASFETFTGLVYKEFDRNVHVIKPFEIHNSWTRLRGIDFGFTNPFVCLWVAIDGDENIYVYDEHYKSQSLLKEHAQVIHAKTGRSNIAATYRDPSAAQEAEELTDLGVYTTPAINTINSDKDYRVGINAVASKLQINPHTGKPKLFVFNNCVNLIEEFQKYRWEEKKDGVNQKEKPMKFNDHAMDALRYILSTYAKQDDSYKDYRDVQYNKYGEPIYV